mmetsp:Transcript_56738/g.178113  ORF Transcript_56738/g.178113 Transcript_56738/m.178113 type:complete len:259 (-) Transcript_56738:165-941(-)
MSCFVAVALVGATMFVPSTGSEGLLFKQDEAPTVNLVRRPSLASLNRQTFNGNVLTEEEGSAENWVVLFCVGWYRPCQALEMPYMGLAEKHSKAFNNDTLLTDFVRFAVVDCSVDKVLCNEQRVETYPMVIHYYKGELLTRWTGGSEARDVKSFRKWLDKELTTFKAISMEVRPLLTRDERRTVMRLLACTAASISFFIWAIGRGTDLLLTMSERRRSEKKLTAKDDAKEPRGEEAVQSRLARRLPREWASARGSVEL